MIDALIKFIFHCAVVLMALWMVAVFLLLTGAIAAATYATFRPECDTVFCIDG